jgi:outer membrane protein assembly factor BamB
VRFISFPLELLRRGKKMATLKKKNATSLTTLLLILTIVGTAFMINIGSVNAYVLDIETHAYGYSDPNPAQVGIQALVTYRIDKVLANAALNFGCPTGLMVTITKPDGTTETFGPYTTDSTSGAYFFYTPTQIGKYYIQTSFPGQWDNYTSGIQRWYKPSISDKYEWTIQEEPIPAYPNVPLPTDYWTRPIYGENKGWNTIADNWLQIRYDYVTTGVTRVTPAFAPYTSAPDSAHVLWAKPLWLGGIAGGRWNDTVYYTGLVYEEPYEPIIQAGRLYYIYHDQTSTTGYGTYCLNLYTGEQIYYLNNTLINFAQDFDWESPNEHGVLPYLWSTSGSSTNTTMRMFDPMTGEQRLTITNVTAGYIKMGPKGEVLMYTLDTVKDRLIMFNSTKAVTPSGINWSPAKGAIFDGLKGIEWNVSIPNFPATTGTGTGIVCINEGYILAFYPDTLTGDSYVFTHVAFPDTLQKDSTGQYPTSVNYLWIANRTDLFRAYLPSYFNINEGVYADYAEDTHVMHCYDVKTGNELWKTQIENASLWTNFSYDRVVAYGKVFLTGYDGHVRAWYIANGTLAWDYYFGSSGKENAYGTYPVHNGMTVADHKLFISNDEHSPDSTMWRGSKLWCIDTETGQLMWKTGGWLRLPVISDGILTACSGYDNQIYTFGIGPSKTTVTAPQTQIELGQSIVITGSVTDQTSGPYCKTKDTPCISDASMGEWMDYMYCQKPQPQNATGVPVVLDVIDANGNYRNIGTVHSSASGVYSFNWQPDIPGKYTLIATFPGSNAYGSSRAETAVYAVDAPSTTSAPSPIPQSAADLYFVPAVAGLFVLVIIVLALVVLLMLRKRP